MHGIQDWMGTQWDYPVVCSGELRYFFGEPRSYLEFAKHMIASVLFCEPHPDLMVEKMIFPTIWWIFWVFPYFQTIAKMKVPFSLLASCWTFWLILILTLNDLRWFFFGKLSLDREIWVCGNLNMGWLHFWASTILDLSVQKTMGISARTNGIPGFDGEQNWTWKTW